ncbi:galectin-7-like isoform X2 [Zootermopsis nevadensis]|uniref:galectin-7-like isoform X2 n=1 Tax=Zootermopsis nevadensis TaxID=136037 RepID=UPI000B8E964D|nr:galectin-7-like isoform X2 [Zootermopsis nevadensis]
MGWKRCLSCCGYNRDVQRDEDEIPVEVAQEMDEQFVFIEQFPTDKKMENPTVPFIGELPVPIDVGRVIDVEGEILPHATRFSVDLVCGSTQMSDVAFHLNPRFDQNHVVRNSRLGGRWGHEECSASQRNPFQRGTKFCLIILAAEDGFMVAVNNYHFCSYDYRTLRMRIQTVQIHGDVIVNSLDYHMTNIYPEIRPRMQDPAVIISHTMPLSNSIKDNVFLCEHTRCHAYVAPSGHHAAY